MNETEMNHGKGIEILTQVRDAVGRTYKDMIRRAWMDGNYERDLLKPWEGPLQRIRNVLGPSWLKRARLQAQVAEPATLENTEVVKAVTQVAQSFKTSIKAQFAAHYRSAISQWEKKCQETPGKTSVWTFWSADGNIGRFAYTFNQQMRSTVGLFLDSEHRPAREWMHLPHKEQEQSRYFLKPAAEVDAIIERRSEKEAEEAIQSFVCKMSKKLQGILDAKGDFVSVEVHGSLGQNCMTFKFADECRFTVVNDIIINHSCLGTPFNQYPTRFTSVMAPGKQWHGNLSEAQVKKLFKSPIVKASEALEAQQVEANEAALARCPSPL